MSGTPRGSGSSEGGRASQTTATEVTDVTGVSTTSGELPRFVSRFSGLPTLTHAAIPPERRGGLVTDPEEIRRRFHTSHQSDRGEILPANSGHSRALLLRVQREELQRGQAPDVAFRSLLGLAHVNNMVRDAIGPKRTLARSHRPPEQGAIARLNVPRVRLLD
jgi:hypothetical protein